jgi:hypothetical protein
MAPVPPFEAGTVIVDAWGQTSGTVRSAVVPIYYCPSRRGKVKVSSSSGANNQISATDYASAYPGSFPMTATEDPRDAFHRPGGSFNAVIEPNWYTPPGSWGLGQYRNAKVTFGSVTDGTSNTIMIAEKFVPTNFYTHGSGDAWGDDLGPFCGWNIDHARSTVGTTTALSNGTHWPNPIRLLPNPSQDRSLPYGSDEYWGQGYIFGSAHPGGINAVLGDGSVRQIRYGVAPNVFNLLGHRTDGAVIPGDF